MVHHLKQALSMIDSQLKDVDVMGEVSCQEADAATVQQQATLDEIQLKNNKSLTLLLQAIEIFD